MIRSKKFFAGFLAAALIVPAGLAVLVGGPAAAQTSEPSPTATPTESATPSATESATPTPTPDPVQEPTPVSLTIRDDTAPEGDGDSEVGNELRFVIAVEPVPDAPCDLVLDARTLDGTAEDRNDYQFTTDTVFLDEKNGWTADFVVPIHGDERDEDDETMFAEISDSDSSCEQADLTTSIRATGTIVDDDDAAPPEPCPIFTEFPNSENAPPQANDDEAETRTGRQVFIDVLDNDVDPDGGESQPYVWHLTNPPHGDVEVMGEGGRGDIRYRPDAGFVGTDTFEYTICDADGGADTALVTVEVLPLASISVTDPSVIEGESGIVQLAFDVSVSHLHFDYAEVDYSTRDLSATRGEDYNPTSGTLSFVGDDFRCGECALVRFDQAFFSANEVSTSELDRTKQTVLVDVVGDVIPEQTESLALDLVLRARSNDVNLARPFGTGTIVTDDLRIEPPTVDINDVRVTEGDGGTTNATFTLSLDKPAPSVALLDVATESGSALAGQDFTQTSTRVVFSPGDSSQTVSIPVVGDLIDEPEQNFFVTLQTAGNVVVAGDGRGVATIVDNDDPPTISVSEVVEVTEGNAGTTTDAIFEVSLSLPSELDVAVDFATGGASAHAGEDYESAAGTLQFAPGETTHTVGVTVLGDDPDELNESFNLVALSGGTGISTSRGAARTPTALRQAPATAAVGVGTILDDDLPPVISVDSVSVDEGDSGQTPALFTISLSTPSALEVVASYRTVDASALAPFDYDPRFGALAFQPGQTRRTLAVWVNGDELEEGDEAFALGLLLGSDANATPGDLEAIATIVDDDAPQEITDEITDEIADEVRGLILTLSDQDPPAGPGPSEGPPDVVLGTELTIDVPGSPDAELGIPSTLPGGEIFLSGNGCRPGEVVPIFIDDTHVASTRADENGAFETRFDAATDLPVGRHLVAVECDEERVEVPLDVVLTNSGAPANGAVIITVFGLFMFFMFQGRELFEQERGEGRTARKALSGAGYLGGGAAAVAATPRQATAALPWSWAYGLGVTALLLVGAAIAVVGLGRPQPSEGIDTGAISVAGVDLGSGETVALNLDEPIPVDFGDLELDGADRARLTFSVSGIDLTSGEADLKPIDNGAQASIDASERGFLLAGTFTGTVKLLDDDSVVSTTRFAAASDEPVYFSTPAEVTFVLLLFAAGGAEVVLRRMRRGKERRKRMVAAVGFVGGVAGAALTGVIALIVGREPTLVTALAAALAAGVGCLLAGIAALRGSHS